MKYRSKLNQAARNRTATALKMLSMAYGNMSVDPVMNGDKVKTSAADRRAFIYEQWINAIGRYEEQDIINAVESYIQNNSKWPNYVDIKNKLISAKLHPDYVGIEKKDDDYDQWPLNQRRMRDDIVRKHMLVEWDTTDKMCSICTLGVTQVCLQNKPEKFVQSREEVMNFLRNQVGTKQRLDLKGKPTVRTGAKPYNLDLMDKVLDNIANEIFGG